jgi:hypothetical protein
MSEAQGRLDVYAVRDAWSRRLGEACQETIERFVVLAIEDFDFQSGPRGVSPQRSAEEVRESVERVFSQMAEEVMNQMYRHLIDEGRLR